MKNRRGRKVLAAMLAVLLIQGAEGNPINGWENRNVQAADTASIESGTSCYGTGPSLHQRTLLSDFRELHRQSQRQKQRFIQRQNHLPNHRFLRLPSRQPKQRYLYRQNQ